MTNHSICKTFDELWISNSTSCDYKTELSEQWGLKHIACTLKSDDPAHMYPVLSMSAAAFPLRDIAIDVHCLLESLQATLYQW